MFFPIEIGTYQYILRLCWYGIDYIIRILVSGVLVTSKWRIWENMSTRQHRLRNEGRKGSLPTRCIQSVAKIIIENNTLLGMADVFRLLCICVFSNRYFLFHCVIDVDAYSYFLRCVILMRPAHHLLKYEWYSQYHIITNVRYIGTYLFQ